MPAAFALRELGRDLVAVQLLRGLHRRSHGVIATAKNSGTHWLQQMLSLAIAHHHGLPPPRDVHPTSNEYVGMPKGPRPYPHLPFISRSHYTPHRLMASPAFRGLVRLPPTVVLVRDPRSALVSHYEKRKAAYGGIGFPDYLRGDPAGRRFDCDVWWLIHFFNSWGRALQDAEGWLLPVRYEDLQGDPAAWLGRIARHLRLGLSEEDVAAAVAGSGKGRMRSADPAAAAIFVREDSRDPLSWYGPEDRRWLDRTLAAHLAHDFGYALGRWPAEAQSA